MSSTKAIAASIAPGAVDFLFLFGIRNKSEKSNSEPGTEFSAFYSGFDSRRLLPSRLRNSLRRAATELPVLLTENDNCQAARMIIRTGAFEGVP
jgi:hypothetical protein